MNRSKFTAKEALNVRDWKIKQYNVGLQVPSHLDSQIQEKIVIWTTPKMSWRSFQRFIYTKGERSRGRSPNSGPFVHMLLSISQKYSIAQIVGFIKGKSAIHIARSFSGHKRNFTGKNFWAKGYMFCAHSMQRRKGRSRILKKQEAEDRRLD